MSVPKSEFEVQAADAFSGSTYKERTSMTNCKPTAVEILGTDGVFLAGLYDGDMQIHCYAQSDLDLKWVAGYTKASQIERLEVVGTNKLYAVSSSTIDIVLMVFTLSSTYSSFPVSQNHFVTSIDSNVKILGLRALADEAIVLY